MKPGVVFGVCDLAMTVYSMKLAEDAKLKPEDVKNDMVAGLLPGIVVLPSGIYAVNRAQNALSAIAMSYESPVLPTEGSMPASANRSV